MSFQFTVFGFQISVSRFQSAIVQLTENRRVRHSFNEGGKPKTVNRKPAVRLPLTQLIALVAIAQGANALEISDSQAARIGRRIWQNECGGTVSGLTSWNAGEDFASLGIGHFLWYPAGKRGPFEESFPPLLKYLESRGVALPDWLKEAKSCPWSTRSEFEAARESTQMRQLRSILASTVALQARFASARLEAALPKILEAAPASEREKIRTNFYRVAANPAGVYALVDYVNFKGEGTLPTERYHGQGWGLLQVLEAMGSGEPLREFSNTAAKVLKRRVANAPPARGEGRWLPGWLNRVHGYAG
jgi:hypothetical protein